MLQLCAQGWVRSTGLSLLRDLRAVAFALPCSTCPSQWAKQHLWFHSTCGFTPPVAFLDTKMCGWVPSCETPLREPCLVPFPMGCGQPQGLGGREGDWKALHRWVLMGLNILPGVGFPSVFTLVLSPLVLWESLS